jgi:PIN domain nuclease of toxin-antitoxin system
MLNSEPGAERVASVLPEAVINAVNLAEVATKLAEAGLPTEEVLSILQALELSVIDFDQVLAYRVGELRRTTREGGLSLGDRACVAMAQSLRAPILTTDRSWSQLDLDVQVQVIR